MNLTTFIILSLAVWRLSKILTVEVGPYQIFERFRNEVMQYRWSPLHCFKCTSVWVGFIFSLFVWYGLASFVFIWLGSSALAILIESELEKEEITVVEKKHNGM